MRMNRRELLKKGSALAATSTLPGVALGQGAATFAPAPGA
jgi:hypothetical protein